jgi:branched-chain amino acid transport system ATP-binding protein
MIGRPKILLLDEPAAGLSIKESLDAARWGVTVLLVEHDMDVVFSICDRITVLHLGTVLAEGSPEEIRNIPAVIMAYLGSAT